jgi:proline racemase
MYGALLTPPEREDSHAGVLFMHNEGYSTMCGHGVIAVTTIAVERNLIVVPREADGSVRLTLDSPAGPIHAVAKTAGARTGVAQRFSPAGIDVAQGFSPAGTRVTSVTFRNVPSFVLHPSLTVRAGHRDIRADVAFGGAFYAIVDSEAVGIPIVPERLPDLRRVGMEIKHAVEKAVRVEHPLDPQLKGLYGTVFTGPPSGDNADLRNVTIFADAQVDRSPCGTGTAAVMAVLAAMGMLVAPGQIFRHESIIGTTFRGRVAGETKIGELDAIIPEIEGEAFITGESTFLIDDDDPLRHGFRI